MGDHNAIPMMQSLMVQSLMMQRMLFAGTLGLAMARRAAAILDAEPTPRRHEPAGADGAVLRAILDAANDCLGPFDDRPAAERWCDSLSCLLDLATFAAEIGGPASL